MFYLFILESIGTSELIMIGLVALIIFGPRRLPEMMRMFGKAVAEFRRSTDDFKKTWQKEVDFESNEFNSTENSDLLLGNEPKIENSIGRVSRSANNIIAVPEIREVDQNEFSSKIPKVEAPVIEKTAEDLSADKRNWL